MICFFAHVEFLCTRDVEQDLIDQSKQKSVFPYDQLPAIPDGKYNKSSLYHCTKRFFLLVVGMVKMLCQFWDCGLLRFVLSYQNIEAI